MTRWFAGTLAPHGQADGARLAAALAPRRSHTLNGGALRVAHTGAAIDAGAPLCLLDGHVDNLEELCEQLGRGAEETAESLLWQGYLRWGTELPGRLRGDFALLVWDRECERGLIARDQLGVRCVYLHEHGGCLSFATEVRHLLALLTRTPAPDPLGVAHWITITGRPGDGTLYQGVRRIAPGSMLLLSGRGTSDVRYWKPCFAPPLELPTEELTERVRRSLELAVDRRLDRGGVTGVLMSGGLDSSSVAALAASLSEPGAVLAYSAEFPEHPAVDESELIAQLRANLALPGVTAEVRPGGLLASALTWLHEWKLPLSSWGEFWAAPLLDHAAQAGVGTMLGGDGGDELFDCRAYLLADLIRAGRLGQARLLAQRLPGFGQSPPRRALARAVWRFGALGALPAGTQELAGRLRRPNPPWLAPEILAGLRDSADDLAWKRLDGPRWWAYDTHVLTRGVEELGLFENHRRRAALAGLESRHPLFDFDLLELCLRQPPRATFDPAMDRPVLRASMAGLLPDPVRLRPVKALFDSLLVDCLGGEDAVPLRQLLMSPKARLAEYVNMSEMNRALFDGDARASFRWMYQAWRLATAECWLRYQEGGDIGGIERSLQSSAPRVKLRAARPAQQAHTTTTAIPRSA